MGWNETVGSAWIRAGLDEAGSGAVRLLPTLRNGDIAMANVVALLESMWGWRGYSKKGDEIRYFRINPDNFSEKRLYLIVGNHNLLVTNSCRECQATANQHGKPDPAWVAENLKFLEGQGINLLLVCGRVAQETFGLSGGTSIKVPVLFMDHPAARRWTNAALDGMAKRVTELLQAANA
jgi:hypothetical protein